MGVVLQVFGIWQRPTYRIGAITTRRTFLLACFLIGAAAVLIIVDSALNRLLRLSRNAPWLCLASAVVVAALLAQIIQMRFGRDQGLYAMVASTIAQGGMPYRDAWDFKPPGIYLVYAAAHVVFGRNEWGIRLIEALFLASLWPTLRRIGRHAFGDVRVGSVACALSILMLAELEFWHTAQPETFGGVLTLWALALIVDGNLDVRKTALAGVLFGAAALMKPHLEGGALIAALYLGLRNRRTGYFRIKAPATLIIASLLPSLGTLLWFASKGALKDLLDTLFGFAPGYVATTFQLSQLPALLYNAVIGSTCGFSALVPVGLVLHLTHQREGSAARSGMRLIAAMAIPQVVGIAMQAKFFPYHHAGLLPLLALIAAPGLLFGWDLMSQRWGWMGIVVAGLIGAGLLVAVTSTRDLPNSFLSRSYLRTRALLVASEHERRQLDAQLYSVADVSYGANQQVAKWLMDHTREEDSVFLWGFEPFVYYLAGRSPASRFIYNVPQRGAWSKDWARPELMRDLMRTKPKVIVVARHDVFPVVTGNVLDSRDSLNDFPELNELIESRYLLEASVEDFDLYSLREDSEARWP